MRKNQFLETENIFLDTSVFEKNNFISSTKIHSLLQYAQSGVIRIHVTTVSKMELFNRIDKRIAESRSELKKLNRGYNGQNTRIIKNLNFFKKIQVPDIDIKNHSTELKEKIDSAFKRANVNTIRTQDIRISELVRDYYDRKPPFHNSGKQNEFIDAFILKSLEKWCVTHKTKMYVLSNDNDFLDYKSKNLILTNDLSDLLVQITRYYNKRYKINRITRIREIIKKNKSALEQHASELINEKITLRGKNVDIAKPSINSTKLFTFNIISIKQDLSEIECIFNVELSFIVFEENDFAERRPQRVTKKFSIALFVEIKRHKIDIKPLLENPDLVYEHY